MDNKYKLLAELANKYNELCETLEHPEMKIAKFQFEINK